MKNVIRNKAYLEVLCKSNKSLRTELLQKATSDQRKALIEVIVNLLNGKIKLSKNSMQKLTKAKKKLRLIRELCYDVKRNKIINTNSVRAKSAVVQTGYILPFLLIPALIAAGKAAALGAAGISAGINKNGKM